MKYQIILDSNDISHFVCTSFNNISKVHKTKKSENLADKTDAPLLGDIPLDSSIFENWNREVPFILSFPDSVATHSFLNIARKIQESVEKHHPWVIVQRETRGNDIKKGGKNGERDN